MEIIEIIGIDPSLRFTGIGKISYNTETKKFKVSGCQVIKNKTTLKGTQAISAMLKEINKASESLIYENAVDVIVESPVVPFMAKFQSSSMISIAHISGGAAISFGIDRARLFRPSEWNKSRKKEKTHALTQEILGSYETWSWDVIPKRKDYVEHVLDAVSMALWYIQEKYIEK